MDIEPHCLSRILKDLYSAVVEPSERASLADRIAAAFDSRSCLVQVRELEADEIDIVGVTRNCAPLMPSYVEYYYAQDFWTERALRRLGAPLIGEDIVPQEELVRTELYGDLLKPHEIHHVVGSVFQIETNVIGCIGVHRPHDGSGFGDHDRAKMGLILPHLLQALKLMRSFGVEERVRRITFETLSNLSLAVFVVAADARILLMNSAAEGVVRNCPEFVVRHGRLALSKAKDDNPLQAAVGRAALAAIGRSLCAGVDLVVSRTVGPSILLRVVPVPPDIASFGTPEPMAIVFVGQVDAENGSAVSDRALQLVKTAYRLTAAEARVALAVVEGQMLADFAVENGISLNTAQAQLKSVFSKIGCHRQVDLVRKIMTDPLLRISGL